MVRNLTNHLIFYVCVRELFVNRSFLKKTLDIVHNNDYYLVIVIVVPVYRISGNPVIEKIKEILQQKGLKATPQRIVVYDALRSDISHPSPETIYTRVYKKIPSISKATVYKILETFEKKGIVSVVSSHHNTTRYDPLTSRHHHIVCKKCNKIVDVVDSDLDNITVPEQVTAGNKLIDFTIHFLVICPECQ